MVQREKFSTEFKTKVVLELIAGKRSLSEASREYQIKDSVLSRWKQEFLERASEIFEQPPVMTRRMRTSLSWSG